MHTDEYVQEVEGLDTDSKRRLSAYATSLNSDKRSTNCDKQVLGVLSEYAYDEKRLRKTMKLLKQKDYTQSWYRYSFIEKQAERFAGKDHTYFGWNQHYKKAKAEIIKDVKSWKLRSLQYNSEMDILDAIPRRDTHAGWTYITSGKRTKGENLEGIFQSYSTATQQALEDGYFKEPILIGYRTQAKPPFDPKNGEFDSTWSDVDKCKSRLVSMIDLKVILAESVYAKPFQHRLGQTTYYAGGKDDSEISNLVSAKRSEYNNWLTLDYSHYDQSISSWLIRDAFEIVKEAFIFDPFFDEALFNVVMETFIHKVFVVSDLKHPIQSHKGVPSGSMFTQIIDTLVNLLMIKTYLNATNCDHYHMIIMGDDNLIFTHEKLDETSVASYLERNFGIECHPDKCAQGTRSDDPEFLSRFWTPLGAWRHPNTLIAKMTHPERYRDYKDKDLKLDPALIVYAYILSFPAGMKELIDIDKFRHDYGARIRKWRKGDLIHASGSLRYRILYGGCG